MVCGRIQGHFTLLLIYQLRLGNLQQLRRDRHLGHCYLVVWLRVTMLPVPQKRLLFHQLTHQLEPHRYLYPQSQKGKFTQGRHLMKA